MEITVHDVPIELHQALVVRAAAEQTTVSNAMLEAAARDLGIAPCTPQPLNSSDGEPPKYRDLSDIAGTWVEDPKFDAIIEEQSRIDPELWK